MDFLQWLFPLKQMPYNNNSTALCNVKGGESKLLWSVSTRDRIKNSIARFLPQGPTASVREISQKFIQELLIKPADRQTN